jgi:hypothetical protein
MHYTSRDVLEVANRILVGIGQLILIPLTGRFKSELASIRRRNSKARPHTIFDNKVPAGIKGSSEP